VKIRIAHSRPHIRVSSRASCYCGAALSAVPLMVALMHQRDAAAQSRPFGRKPNEHGEIGRLEALRKQCHRRRNDNHL
jgi:hypothetical protein